MPFSFRLPTTSYLAFQDFISSESHPSLPLSATTSRGILRNELKKHKRLPTATQNSNLTTINNALRDYIPLLLAIDAGLSGRSVAGEEILINLEKEVQVEWRTNLSNTIPGREGPRVKLQSFEYELLFTLLVFGETQYLLARDVLHSLYDTDNPHPEQRTITVGVAMAHYARAASIFSYISTRSGQLSKPPPVPDIAPTTLASLASLSLAEATMIAALKDDPYPAAVVQDRNQNDKEWMYKNPEIPKVRAHLYARLCIAAADHASKGLATLGRSGKVNDSLPRYFEDLRRTAKGKACRFLGIDAELSGNGGEGIAWLRGARKELGFARLGEEKKSKGLSKLKKSWDERREDRKIEKGGEWGSDAGKFEEGRVVDMLMVKWEKMNNTVCHCSSRTRCSLFITG